MALREDGSVVGIFGIARPLQTLEAAGPAPALTPRQHQVLRLLGEGVSTGTIASSLALSERTVRNHVRALLASLGAHSRLEAVAVARRYGLLRELAEIATAVLGASPGARPAVG